VHLINKRKLAGQLLLLLLLLLQQQIATIMFCLLAAPAASRSPLAAQALLAPHSGR
jgi:hypothetical protein